MTDRVCAIVTTYKKNVLLKECLESIFGQTLCVDVIVVDNFCPNGAEEYLAAEGLLSKVDYMRTEKNLGGAGGFAAGMRHAYEKGYDWFILCDDDGKAKNAYTFEALLSAAKEKYSSLDKVFYNSVVLCDDETLAFGLNKTLSYEKIKRDHPVLLIGGANPFNGTLVSRGLAEAIGYPDGKFFIKGDEIDYLARAREAGAAVATVTDSLYLHPSMPDVKQKTVFGEKMFVYIEAPWKEFYNVRNHCYILLIRNRKKEARLFKYKRIYCALVCKCKKSAVIKMIFKGYKAAKKGIFDNTVGQE